MTALLFIAHAALIAIIYGQTKPSLKSHIIVAVCAIILRVLGFIECFYANGGLL